MTNTAPANQYRALRDLQARIGQANAAKGFHEEGDRLRRTAEDAANLRRYYSEKLLLIVSEVTEAQDELRSGRAVDETYYSGGTFVAIDEGQPFSDADPRDSMGNLRKPEGVPSELADVVIRAFDFADEAGIDLAAIIDEKLAYNQTRPHLHGKKF